MKAILNLFFFAVAFCVLLASCKSDDVVSSTESITIKGGPGLYVVGYEWNNMLANVAMCWKNGEAINLSGEKSDASASSVYVTETDVYVAGKEANRIPSEFWPQYGPYIAKYWKNGVGINLTYGATNAYASSIYVSGTDVYVAGGEGYNNGGSVAKYWKNGAAVILPTDNAYASASSIFVTGNDVYVAGTDGIEQPSGNSQPVAKYWKNGKAVNLTDGTTIAGASSIFVVGNDVYVAGYKTNSNRTWFATFWKNGIAFNLTDGTNDASANSIFVSGNDVYVVGNEYVNDRKVVKYWKNGVGLSLTKGPKDAIVGSIFVSNGNVYIAGTEWSDNVAAGAWVAKYWKDGTAVDLSGATLHQSWATSVFAK